MMQLLGSKQQEAMQGRVKPTRNSSGLLRATVCWACSRPGSLPAGLEHALESKAASRAAAAAAAARAAAAGGRVWAGWRRGDGAGNLVHNISRLHCKEQIDGGIEGQRAAARSMVFKHLCGFAESMCSCSRAFAPQAKASPPPTHPILPSRM